MAQKLPIMISDPHGLVATGNFGGLSPPHKAQTKSVSGVLMKFAEGQAPTKSPY